MSLSSEIYQKIRLDLQDPSFGSNEFLNEAALAARYLVSKAPVREALHRLCEEGLLVSYPRKGYVLAAVSLQEQEHIRQLRRLNEGFAVEMAARTAPREALEALRRLADQPYTVAVNTRFHMAISSLSECRALEDLVARLLIVTERPLSLKHMLEAPAQQRLEHIRLADALLRGDAQGAKQALLDDLKD